MAEVVSLKSGESPPQGERWALVGRDVSKLGVGAVFCVTYRSDAEGPAAIERAKAWADGQGVPTVYVAPWPSP